MLIVAILLAISVHSQAVQRDLQQNSQQLQTNMSFSGDRYQPIPGIETWDGSRKVPDVKKYPRPHYLKPFRDPITGYRITRVSDSRVFNEEDHETSPESGTLRHHYASCAVWNSDSSRYLLNYGQVRDSKTNKLILRVNELSYMKEHIWSKVNPDLIYGTSANSLKSFNIKTRKTDVLRTFQGFGNLSMDNLKILSDNDRFIVVSDIEAGGKKLAVFDIQNRKVVSQINDIFAHPEIFPGWHRVIPGISPSGKYVVVIDNEGSTHVFDQKLNYLRKLSAGHNHADIGYDVNGNEVLVQTCPARMIRLDTGLVSKLLGKTYGCGHVSLRNYKQPGWAYFSLSQDPNDNAYGLGQVNEIVAVRLDKTGTTVRRLAQPRSTFPVPSIDERYSAMAVPNADGTKVMFNSGWDNPKGEINAYVIDIPLLK